jgi:hypothetical protein
MIFGKLYKVKTKSGDTLKGVALSNEEAFQLASQTGAGKSFMALTLNQKDGVYILQLGSRKLTFLAKEEIKKSKLLRGYEEV